MQCNVDVLACTVVSLNTLHCTEVCVFSTDALEFTKCYFAYTDIDMFVFRESNWSRDIWQSFSFICA